MWNASKSKNMTEDADSTGQNDGACDMCWFFSREVSEKLNVAGAGGAAVGQRGWMDEKAGVKAIGLSVRAWTGSVLILQDPLPKL